MNTPLSSSRTNNSSEKMSPGWMLWAVAGVLIALAVLGVTFQPVHPDALRTDRASDEFIYPIENNSFKRLPTMGGNINDIHVSADGLKIWAVGSGGLIVHSRDGGSSWLRQNPTKDRKQKPAGAITSVWNPLISSAHAQESSPQGQILEQQQTSQQPEPPKGNSRSDFNSNVGRQKVSSTKLPTTKSTPIDDVSKDKTLPLAQGEEMVEQKGGPIEQNNKSPTAQKSNTQTLHDNLAKDDSTTEKVTAVSMQSETAHSDLYAVHFSDEKYGKAVGDNGMIFSTSNGGKTWSRESSNSNSSLKSVQYIDASVGWVVVGNGAVLRKPSNEASLWSIQNFSGPESIQSAQFFDDQLGWLVTSDQKVMRTQNGGRSWSYLNIPVSDENISAISFVDQEVGWAVGTKGAVLRTKNGGDRWSLQNSLVNESLNDVHFIDAKQGWIVSSTGSMLVTSDGGEKWTSSAAENIGSIDKVVGIKPSRAWAIASDAIYSTSNNGLLWRQRTLGGYGAWIHFIDESQGWLLTQEGKLLRTEDGGVGWSRLALPDVPSLYDMYFEDARRGWLVGSEGTILHTSDGGKTWKKQDSGTDAELLSIFFVTGTKGWATGAKGTILTTDDGGQRWIRQKSDTTGLLNEVFFNDSVRGWVANDDGPGRRTTDGGVTWQEMPQRESDGTETVHFVDSTKGWMVSYRGEIYQTTNGGNSWNLVKKLQDSPWLEAIDFVDSTNGWIVGENGTVLNTADGGRTWLRQDIDSSAWLTDVQFLDQVTGWAVGGGGTLLNTKDSGATWQTPQYKRYPAGWTYAAFAVALVLLWQANKKRTPEIVRESIADRLVSDRPLSMDDPGAGDLIKMADGISHFIRNVQTDPPLTMAVTGQWGSGKSSLMNLLKEDLEKRSYHPVWFNAWHHQKGENLLASLVANIRSQGVPSILSRGSLGFRSRLFVMRGWRQFIRTGMLVVLMTASLWYLFSLDAPVATISSMIDGLKNLEFDSLGLGAIGGVLIPLAAFLKLIQAFGLSPVSLMTGMTEGLKSNKLKALPGARFQFAREFADVTSALGDRKMVLFIDDLDRCEESHVVEVLEVVNYLMTSGRCIVILGMDPDYVELCVGLQFQNMASAQAAQDGGEAESAADQKAFARHYMEKLINLSVRIPTMDEKKSKALLTRNRSAEDEADFWDKWFDIVNRYWTPTAIIGVLGISLYLGYRLGELAIEEIRATPPVISRSFDSTLLAVNLLDAKHGVAVGEGGVILITKDGGMSWSTSDGKTVNVAVVEQSDASDDASSSTLLPEGSMDESREIPKRQSENIVGWFEPGQKSDAVLGFVASALLLLLAALLIALLRMRAPSVVEHDSKEFSRTLGIWLPWITLRRKTPRLLKRYLNEVRYLAMQYRSVQSNRSAMRRLVDDLRGDPRPDVLPDQPESLNEAKIVVLSAIHQVRPEWVTDAEAFAELMKSGNLTKVLERDLDAVLAAYSAVEGAEIDSKLNQLAKSIDDQLADPELADRLPTEVDRRIFVEALGGNRV